VDPVEAVRAGATAPAGRAADLVLVPVTARELVPEAEALALVGLARRERTRERAAKFLRAGWEPVARAHRELMVALDRLERLEAELSKAEPSKWALARVVRAAVLVLVAPERKAAHGISWEGAEVARRSIRTRAASGLRARAQPRVVLGERAAARSAELG
jgi:hypothetical protein